MSLLLYGHPFSSYTQKVLVALFENDVPHSLLSLDDNALNHAQHTADWLERWPLRTFPLLVDADRSIVEASVIVEYLQLAYPGAVPLLPEDPLDALNVRFLDRFFDLHVIALVQHAVGGALSGDALKKQEAHTHAAEKLELAYAWLEAHLARNKAPWVAGANFTLADCAAAPSLFYADWTHPISAAYPEVRAYRARLLARPSFARAVDGGRPFRHYFPLGAPDRD
ncbi:glutathione S-transferase family protein [Massilia sp. IC2-476]|uniref:glutathione S-transferase family protein n=1 Tax=Massilia sp. IC2-476 TaxID=2887199 RepID=UPI001D12F61F|nr:glutathione S-transferase family protein [Massilia sp. IC2-476]MCC2971375.1 glutathione S-transferase family protein [Massilia sp. IC2-476]